jgi:AraC family transcriptional regulator of adaptative response/methylated-DNA-[protein]-cysteine methyltransferase
MKTTYELPPTDEMYQALLDRNADYEGVFFVGVRTTGVFCRPTCSARKPKRSNIEFFPSVRDALAGGFRPCRRCRPLRALDGTPEWLEPLLQRIEEEPQRRWTDRDLTEMDLEPRRVRRWFKAQHGMTFQSYSRARRLGSAFRQLSIGGESTTAAALDNGFESDSGFRAAFHQWFGNCPSDRELIESPITVARLTSPLGPMICASTSRGICLLEFADRRMLETQLDRVRLRFGRPFAPGRSSHLDQLEVELKEYFAGTRSQFDVPLDLHGTRFQVAVWGRLQEIPFGETISYDRLARDIGAPGGQRAVGRANGDNRIAIVVPCHRVIRRDGSISGYGGGVWRKQWLLSHEKDVAASPDARPVKRLPTVRKRLSTEATPFARR